MGGSTIFRCVASVALAAAVSAAPSSEAVRPATPATPVLWRDPGPLATKDLYWGPGDAARAPRPPFVFVQEDRTGTKPKVRITDATGVFWTAKFPSQSKTGSEVHAEIAASRLVWALGYFVEEHYFVANETITGVTGTAPAHLLRARPGRPVQRGALRAAAAGCLERRPLGPGRQSVCRLARAIRPEDPRDAREQLGRAPG